MLDPINGEYYLIVVDAFSKWPEIYPTKTISAQRTVEIMEDIFARFGIPETLVTDNGTQFISEKFQSFCLSYGIQHLRTPPFHPSSNGLTERFVDTFKRGLQKLTGGENIRNHLPIFLKQYRSTPNVNVPNKVSPAEALIGRPMRTVLDLLKPSIRQQPQKDDIKLRQEQQFNRKHGVKSKAFEVDSEVYVKIYNINKWKWIPGKIVERIGQVLYNVAVPTRQRLVRAHANQLRPRFSVETKESPQDEYVIE
ncbi:PREDICTED: uncharacterized protein K02A2.6-like [Cyphomyrmex costatus]|nr:PREDICTED: uncharacterized protein K02A2.6-like [Cyphomyrmex costatus]